MHVRGPGGQLQFVLSRNPLEVAKSLEHRENFLFREAVDLWHVYNQGLLDHTKPENRLITHYDTYFADPHNELRRLIDFIGLVTTKGEVEKACGATIPSLKHNRSTLADLIASGTPVETVNSYAEMCLQAGQVYWDSISNPVEGNASDASPKMGGISEQGLLRWLDERESILQAFTAEFANLSTQAQEYQEKIRELEHQLKEVYISRAWRLNWGFAASRSARQQCGELRAPRGNRYFGKVESRS